MINNRFIIAIIGLILVSFIFWNRFLRIRIPKTIEDFLPDVFINPYDLLNSDLLNWNQESNTNINYLQAFVIYQHFLLDQEDDENFIKP